MKHEKIDLEDGVILMPPVTGIPNMNLSSLNNTPSLDDISTMDSESVINDDPDMSILSPVASVDPIPQSVSVTSSASVPVTPIANTMSPGVTVTMRVIKRKPLTLAEKMEIIKKVDASPHLSRVQMAKDLGLPITTLNGIMSKREKIHRRALEAKPLDRKKVKIGKYDKLEAVLLKWVRQTKAVNLPLNGSIIKQMCEEIARKMNMDFKVSNGWIDRFKKRYGIEYKSYNKDGSKTVYSENTWKTTTLPTLLDLYKPRDIFNADECGLFYSVLPDKTFAFKGDGCLDGKYGDERITVLVCANMDGSEKLPLWVVGNPKPKSLKNVKTLPCTYRSNSSSWMTTKIFTEFLSKVEEMMAAKKRKILLFVDQCAAHMESFSNFKYVRVEYLPSNMDCILQPMDQGVTRALKHNFRKKLVIRFLQKISSTSEHYKISLLDAMSFLSASWDTVSAQTIVNSFRKAGFLETNSYLEIIEDDINRQDEDFEKVWLDLQHHIEIPHGFEDYLEVDDALVPCGVENVEMLCEKSVPEEPEVNTVLEPEVVVKTLPTCGEALEHLDAFRHFLSGVQDVPEHIIRCLWMLDDYTSSLYSKKMNPPPADPVYM